MAANIKNIEKHKFKKGQSGNPKGRPKEIPELKVLLAEVMSDEKDGINAAKAILLALRNKAIKGDTKAAELLLNRAFGKVEEAIRIDDILTIKVIRE